MGQNNCKLQPGDLIEIDRPRHQHWALYVGDGYVVTLAPVGKQELKVGDHSVPIFIRKVKKELLEKVAGNNSWCVNNRSDQYHTPFPVEEIIQDAEYYIGTELTYRVFGSNCEHFVKKLRYGDGFSWQQRDFEGGEMHIPDMTEDKDCPKPGDLIEIKRGHYEHWALYVGDGYVIHVTAIGGNSPTMSAGSMTILTKTAKVKKELLKEVVKNDKWCVNNKYDCYRTPFPMEEIVRRAEQWIDREVPYGVFLKNCEHFVTKLRYGDGVSEQAKIALQKLNSISSLVDSIVSTGTGTACLLVRLSGPVMAVASSIVLVSIPLISSHIAQSFTCAKFVKTKKDILERRCC